MTRDAVIKALEICGTNADCCSCPYYRCDDCLGSMMMHAKAIIVNSAPVKHGEWEYKPNLGGYKCSLCGQQAPFWCMASTQNLTNYCPYCGAKMDGGKDDDKVI